MRFSLQVSQDVQLSCVIEIRHVDSDGFLGAKIVDISGADAEALSRLIDDYFAAARA
jgi:hypothetical protein